MTNDIALWIVGNTPTNPLPAWVRTTAISGGDVFVAARIAGDERSVALCAAADGEPTIAHLDHVFVRVGWMRGEYPYTAELLDLIERRVRDAAAGRPAARQRRSRAEVMGVVHG